MDIEQDKASSGTENNEWTRIQEEEYTVGEVTEVAGMLAECLRRRDEEETSCVLSVLPLLLDLQLFKVREPGNVKSS